VGILANTLTSIVAGIETVIMLQSVSKSCATIGTLCIILSGLIATTISVFTWHSTQRLSKRLNTFHDFITTYRQTPISKIRRRHFPLLDAVEEEASQFE
jgi:hypothetical protein